MPNALLPRLAITEVRREPFGPLQVIELPNGSRQELPRRFVTLVIGSFNDYELYEHPQNDAISRDFTGFLVSCYGASRTNRIDVSRDYARMTFDVIFILDEENWEFEYSELNAMPSIVRRDRDRPPPTPESVSRATPTLIKPRRVLDVD